MMDISDQRLFENCNLCPRRCGVARNLGVRGRCGCDSTALVARSALHMWEEPCISGSAGSGTIFFGGCNLGCVYCQNSAISATPHGKPVSVEQLSEYMLHLWRAGAHNINFVTPTHFSPVCAAAVVLARRGGLDCPIVWNTSGYELPEVIDALDGIVDIYLSDFKYLDSALAARYSHAADYPTAAAAALERMVRCAGPAVFDSDGLMRRGVIVRHLALPGCGADSRAVLKYLFTNYGNDIYISLMNQFTPVALETYPEINRRLHRREYDRLVDYALQLGIENAFTQSGAAASESFIPFFSEEDS